MPKPAYAFCRNCGRHRDEAGTMTRQRLCLDCAHELLEENIVGIATKSGPAFRRWRRAMAACVGGVLLDDARPDA
jgi:hypothetical protein